MMRLSFPSGLLTQKRLHLSASSTSQHGMTNTRRMHHPSGAPMHAALGGYLLWPRPGGIIEGHQIAQ